MWPIKNDVKIKQQKSKRRKRKTKNQKTKKETEWNSEQTKNTKSNGIEINCGHKLVALQFQICVC